MLLIGKAGQQILGYGGNIQPVHLCEFRLLLLCFPLQIGQHVFFGGPDFGFWRNEPGDNLRHVDAGGALQIFMVGETIGDCDHIVLHPLSLQNIDIAGRQTHTFPAHYIGF